MQRFYLHPGHYIMHAYPTTMFKSASLRQAVCLMHEAGQAPAFSRHIFRQRSLERVSKILISVFPVHSFDLQLFRSTLSEAARRRPLFDFSRHTIEPHCSEHLICYSYTSFSPVLEYIIGNRGLGKRQLTASSRQHLCHIIACLPSRC